MSKKKASKKKDSKKGDGRPRNRVVGKDEMAHMVEKFGPEIEDVVPDEIAANYDLPEVDPPESIDFPVLEEPDFPDLDEPETIPEETARVRKEAYHGKPRV
jgi:hypothetical protein